MFFKVYRFVFLLKYVCVSEDFVIEVLFPLTLIRHSYYRLAFSFHSSDQRITGFPSSNSMGSQM